MSASPRDSEVLTVDGARFEVVRHPSPPSLGSGRPRPAPTIVFLHEGLGSAGHWRDFPARVAAATGLDAIAYSRLGYGRSDPAPLPRPLDYMERDARESLPRVLGALPIDDVILFGHSDGASIALVYAALQASTPTASDPDAGSPRPRLRALILEAPHVFVEDLSIASITSAKDSYESGDLRARLARYHGANVDIAFRGWNDAWLAPAFRSWNIERYLPQLLVPVLVLQGEDDAYGTRAQVDAIARQAGGTTTVVLLPNCGHAPHRDARDAVLAHTKAFLANLPP